MRPEDIRAAKGANLAELIGRRVKLERRGRELWGLCPFHKEKSPSFKVENGRFICFGCGARGDAIDWLRATEHLGFADAVREATGAPRAPLQVIARTERPAPCGAPDRRAQAIWQSRRPIAGTLAETYLNSRAIDPRDRPSLGYVDRARHTTGLYLPAMVAAVQAPEGGRPIAVQVTFLDEHGRKSRLGLPRQSFGALCAGAIRFAPAGETLGLAEGAETAMSAQAIFGVPVWASLGAARLDRIGIPDSVRELVIFADNDEAGRAAAERARRRYSTRERRVRVETPPAGFNDFNDLARAEAAP